tara:strand:- start:322 stop:456 length:135 start_codon:yes stop_codon:yes gene_type:complete
MAEAQLAQALPLERLDRLKCRNPVLKLELELVSLALFLPQVRLM